MKTKVLVAVPYHERKRYCLGQLYDSLEAIHASASNELEIEIVVRHDLNPFGQKDNVKIQREFFRRMAFHGGFDYLFFHGADTIPPADVLQRLIADDCPVVSGVYFQRGEKKALNAIAWCEGLGTEDKNKLMTTLGLQNPLVMVSGFGLDCCLIRRDVFEKISFMDWDVNDDDYPFCDRVKNLGITLVIDRSVQCKHWDAGASYSYMGKYFEL